MIIYHNFKLYINCFFLFLVCPTINSAQNQGQALYLLGNTSKINREAPLLKHLDSLIQLQPDASKILWLGDLSHQKSHLDEVLNPVIQLFKSRGAAQYFLSGDQDWDQVGPMGEKKVRDLEKYIENIPGLEKSFLPSKGCPGPKVVELSEQLVIIAINSHWFMHPYDRPEAPETDCKILSEADFWEELEDAIDDYKDHNILIAAHHPIYSSGQYAGKRLGWRHLIPVVGTFYNSYRQQIGRATDMAHPAYSNYVHRMRDLLHNYSSILYLSGHEYHLEAIQETDNIHINSGAIAEKRAVGKLPGSLLRLSKRGFLKLYFHPGGRVSLDAYYLDKKKLQHQNIPLLLGPCDPPDEKLAINTAAPPCPDQAPQAPINLTEQIQSTKGAAGGQYKNSSFRKWAMGEHYREEWNTLIYPPQLRIDSIYGGLRPFAKGGGLQTNSLKFHAADGREYAFRSIGKNPVKALDQLARQTIYRHIVKDLITTQHPYGGLVASKLMDHTDILHARPLLFIMPPDPALGIYLEEFSNRLGTLEIRPKKPKNGQRGFAGADLVHSSNKMFRAMFKNNANRIDRQNYAHARVFDMWLGDWDRHEDNWKWAGFRTDKGIQYRPIPRDRDHVFSQWQGLIPTIADKVVPNAENFGLHFDNIQHLNFKARHLDRQLAIELTQTEWQSAARYLQELMSDERIDEAITTLPDEVESISGPEIAAKLKSRRGELEQAAKDLYLLLAKEVDIPGSNKREIFEVERLTDGGLLVEMYDREKSTGGKGALLYRRVFSPEETKAVRLYGLGGKDEFQVRGESDESIQLYIIGGKGKDQIRDESKVKGWKKMTRIYDSRKQDLVEQGPESKMIHPALEARYNNKAFEYNALAPLPKFRISSGNGFGLELLVNYYQRGFNKPDFAHRYQAKLIYYTAINAQRLDLKYWYRHFVGTADLNVHLRMSSLYDKFPFFYGVGNNSVRDLDLVEADYYRTDFNTIRFNPALEYPFFQKSELRLGVQYEYNNIQAIEEDFSIFNEENNRMINGFGKQHLGGLTTKLNLDFRDHPRFSDNGSQFYLDHVVFGNFSRSGEVFGRLAAYAAHYYTFKPITLAGRIGFSHSYGETPFHYLSPLGSNAFLRAHVRNRYIGKTAAYFNSEIRLSLGNIRTPLFPIRWGILGFFDNGRVWTPDIQESNDWHPGYGGGIYAAPFQRDFNFIFIIGQSDDRELYFNVSTGFDLQ